MLRTIVAVRKTTTFLLGSPPQYKSSSLTKSIKSSETNLLASSPIRPIMSKRMHVYESSSNIHTTKYLFLHILIIILTIKTPATYSLDTVAVSCGSSSDFTALDGRAWIGDSTFKSTRSPYIIGKASNSRAINQLATLESTPYKTARASHHEFSYVFPVDPGQKFIRLHFYQDSYKGFKRSKALFSVKAGPYTLLSNFSTSHTSDLVDPKQIIKEYCLNIDEGRALTLTFSPAQRERKSDDFYAFISGIEVVSMPSGLYFTQEKELGARVVGHKYRFYIDNSTALELVQRLNVGGQSISPAEDSGMFRRWDDDSNYLLEKGAVLVIQP